MLIDELTDSNQSWVLEQQWRKLRSYPTLAQYLAERENIVFTYVLAVLLRAHFRLFDPIPSAVVHHARSVSLITGLENDLISACWHAIPRSNTHCTPTRHGPGRTHRSLR
jgi:hypothetical protein